MRVEAFTGCSFNKTFSEDNCQKHPIEKTAQLCVCKGDRCNKPETIRAKLFSKSDAGHANIDIGMAVLSGLFVKILL